MALLQDLPHETVCLVVSFLPESKDTCSLWKTSKQLRWHLIPIFRKLYKGPLPHLFAATEVHDIRLAMLQLQMDRKSVNKDINGIKILVDRTTLRPDVQAALEVALTERYPLHFAVAKQYPSMVRFLLANGANRRATNSGGKTPLSILSSATGVGSNDLAAQVEMVKLLLKHTPADESFRVDAEKALFDTAKHGSAEVLDAILDSGVDVNTCDEEGRTALFVAHDHMVVDCLLKRGASVGVVDHEGQSALHRATLRDHHESHRIVDILLNRKGINKDLKDHAGKTARQYSREKSGGWTRTSPGQNATMTAYQKTEHLYICREARHRNRDW